MDIVVTAGSEAEFTEKRSRFIANVSPAESEREAREFLQRIKKKYFDARHSPWAFLIGTAQKTNDDGEPGGTAGMPILEVMRRRGVTDAIVVVTRYFGGIKLGAAGLTRAYAKSASLGLDTATLTRRVRLRAAIVRTGYELTGTVENFVRRHGLHADAPVYAEDVATRILIEPGEYEAIVRQIRDLTAGRATISDDGEAVVLEKIS